MKKFVSFGKIPQFRSVVKDIIHTSRYKGTDEKGEPVFDPYAEKPVVNFVGTVKLHGTNAGISHTFEDGLWYQSRKNIITPDKDNAGFAFFAEANKEIFEEAILGYRKEWNVPEDSIVTLFGEWCGKGIQKGVALNELEKMFIIFAVKITPYDEEKVSYYGSLSLDYHLTNRC